MPIQTRPFKNFFAAKDMRVYHGSDVLVEMPKIMQPIRALDFGTGFYTTTNEEQAKSFAKKVQDRNGSAEYHISIYNVNIELLKKQKSLLFEKPNKKWLDFVSANRNGTLSEQETLKRLKIRPLYNQLVLANEEALKCLSFVGELKK